MAETKHVVTRPTSPFRSSDGRLEVHQVPAWQDNLIWLLVYGDDGECAAVDGPPAAGAVLDYCAQHGLRLTTILNTHTHWDHIGLNKDLAKRGRLDDLRVVGSAAVAGDVPGLTEGVSDGDTVTLGRSTGRVLLTEGHIDGHISFVFDDLLLCGDTLFGAGCGYLFDGPPDKMFDSLGRLAGLHGDTRVCCAHEYTQDNLRFAWTVEPENAALAERIRDTWRVRSDGGCAVPSTIALERETNPFLRHDSPPLVERVRAAWPDRDITGPRAIFTATRALKDRKDYKQVEDTALPI